MTKTEAIELLDVIAKKYASTDPEAAHVEADGVLLALAGPSVATAYVAVVEACDWWAHA
jgi:hypothetical protein